MVGATIQSDLLLLIPYLIRAQVEEITDVFSPFVK